MSTGLEWIRLSENRFTARYKIGAVGDSLSFSLLSLFFFSPPPLFSPFLPLSPSLYFLFTFFSKKKKKKLYYIYVRILLLLLLILQLLLFFLLLLISSSSHGRGLKRQSEASSSTAGYVMDVPKNRSWDIFLSKSACRVSRGAGKKNWLPATPGSVGGIDWILARGRTMKRFEDSECPLRDLDQSVHNMSHAGDICTNMCVLIIGTTKTYHCM